MLKLFRKFIVACICLTLTFAAGCAENKENSADAESIVLKVFNGKVEDDNSSGVVSMQHTPQTEIPNEEPIPSLIVIDYRYYPAGVGSLEAEVGSSLASKFQELYQSSTEFDQVRLTLRLPFSDDYGNVSWNHAALIVMSRTTYEKINWDNFVGENLWSVADEVSRESRIIWN